MARSRTRLVFVGLVIVLLVTHVWPLTLGHEDGTIDLRWGWVPWDLAYHLIWMAAAAGVILFMTERVWRDESEGGS